MPSWKKVVLHGSSGSLAHLKLENLTSQNVLGTDAQGNVIAGSVSGYSLPTATGSVLGGIKVGGTLTISAGVLNAKTYVGASAAAFGEEEGGGAAGVAGYVPAASSSQYLSFLRGDGTWQTPTNTVTRLRQSGGTLVAGDFTFAGSGATTVSYSGGTFTISSTNTTYSVGDGGLTEKNFTTTLKNKLDGIAASADNYSGWTISDSTNTESIRSGDTLTIRGAGATTVSYNAATNVMTVSSTDTDTNTTYSAGTGLTLSGTTFSVTANTYAAANHTHDDRYLKLTDTGSFFDRIIDAAPGTLDTLNELAAAIGDDANFSASIAGVLARKADSTHTHGISDVTGLQTALDSKAASNHTHSYDNYQYWTVADRTTSSRLESTNTLTVLGSDGATVTLNATTNTLTISSTDTDTVTSVGVTGNLSTGNIILAGSGATSVTKSGGTITISSTDTNTTYSAGTGLTLSGTTFSVTANTYAAAEHSHAIRDITDLQTTLDGKLSTSGTAAAATSVVTLQDSAPSGTAGKLWWESDTGILKVYYGSAWVDAVPMPDLALYYSKAGGAITGDVSIQQTLTVTGNTTIGGNIAVAGTVDGRDIATDGAKLDGIASGANNYSLPTATSSVLGGIKVGTNLSISNGVLSSTDTDTVTSVGVPGDLSTGNIELRGSGATTITKSGGTITISSTDSDTTYSNATTSAAGLMSSTDKLKLDGIAASANNYSLPLATSSDRGGVKVGYTTNSRNYAVQLSSEQMYVNVPWTDTDTDTVTSVGISGDLSTGNIELRGGGATTITKSGGTITISSTDTDTNTTYSAGTNLALSGTTFNVSADPTFSTVTSTNTTFGRTFNWYGGNLAYSSTSTGTYYRIMRVYYNAGHWGGYGTTKIKIYATNYRGGFQEWTLKNYTGGVYLQLNDYGISPGHSGTVVTLGDAVTVGTYSGLVTYYRDVYLWLGPYFQATYQLEIDGNYGIDADGDTSNYTKFVIWTGGNRTTSTSTMPSAPDSTYHSVNYAVTAGTANAVTWSNVSGRPTAVSSFTNDAGYITSYVDTNTVTSVGISGDLSTGNIEFRGSGATSISKSGGTITVSSTDTNTVTSVGVSGDLSTGNITLAGSGATSISKSGGTITISSTDNNTVTSVGISGDLSTGNVEFRGSGATSISKSGGTITISSTDTNTDTVTSVGVSGNLSTGNIILAGSGATSVTKSGGTITISSTDTNTTYSAGTGLTLSGTTFSVTANTYAAAEHGHSIRDITDLQTTLDGKLNTSGTAAAATSVVTIQDSAPSGTAGKLWWESDTGKLKVYYGSAWIDATPIPDMSLYYTRAGGAITGDVTIQQTLTVVGNVLIQGTLTETSDITLKENITPLQDSLQKVLKLKGVSFNKIATPEVQEIGFIAQEIEEILPELVTETEDGIKTVSYSRVTAVLVETIKEQQAQIDQLKELVGKLVEKVNTL